MSAAGAGEERLRVILAVACPRARHLPRRATRRRLFPLRAAAGPALLLPPLRPLPPEAAPSAPAADIGEATSEVSQAQAELVSEERVVDVFAASAKTEQRQQRTRRKNLWSREKIDIAPADKRHSSAV